ncbi:hypothetical protein ACVWZ3_005492 [Bradyrhizobium sp. i1.3.6]
MIRVSSIASLRCSASSEKARRQNAHGLRHEQPGDDQQHHLRGQQQREDAVGEQFCRPLPALAMDMRIGRHPGGVEGTLGEDRAEMIGQPQRHEKGVGHGAGAQDRREHDVAGKSRQPREQRVTTNREDASEHASVLETYRTEVDCILRCALLCPLPLRERAAPPVDTSSLG